MTTVAEHSITVECDHDEDQAFLLDEAIGRLTDADVHIAARLMRPRDLDRLARAMKLPKRVITGGTGVARMVRIRCTARRGPWVRDAMSDLTSGPLNRIIDELGATHEDPSLDELVEAVEKLVPELGGAVIGLVLAFAVDQGFRAAPHCLHLLETDPRFTPEPPAEESVIEPKPSTASSRDDHHRLEVLTARAARKRARKLERATRTLDRRRYRRTKYLPSAAPDPESDQRPTTSAHDTDGLPLDRRRVRSVAFDKEAAYDEPVVGSVIWSTIRFTGGRRGAKRRPCVVIAGAGRRHLIVRPCYSEGGLQTRRWKSVEVLDRDAAGLDRRSWVAPEEHRVPRRDARRIAGRLATEDWNML